MRKEWVKKAVSVLLAAVMIVTLGACSTNNSKENASSGTPSSSSSPVSSEASKQPSEEVPKEEMTVKVWPVTFSQNFPSGIQEDAVAKDIFEKRRSRSTWRAIRRTRNFRR